MINIVGFLGRPRRHVHGEIFPKHDRLSIENVCSSRNGHEDTVDPQTMQSFEAVIYDMMILPTDQPVGCRSVEEIVLPSALPDEMPWILRIDSDWAAPMCINCTKVTGQILLEI